MKRVGLFVGICAIVWAGLSVPSAGAASSFAGTIFTPERGGRTVVIQGDLDFDPSVCPQMQGDKKLSYTYGGPVAVGLFPETGVVNSWSWLRYSNMGWAPDEGVHYFESTYTSLIPQTYRFVVAGFYRSITDEDEREQWLICQTLSSERISIVERSSISYKTVASREKIDQGESITVSLDQVETWSDGVITQTPAEIDSNKRFNLQGREIGTFNWVKLDSSATPAFTISPQATTEYRVLLGTRVAETVTVEVNRPSLAVRIQDVQVSPTRGIVGSTLRLSAAMETQYSDGSWKPSPAGTEFEVQFRVAGSRSWADVSGRRFPGRLQSPGDASLEVPLSESGEYRFISNGAISESVSVTAIQPTSVVAMETLKLPNRVKRKSRIRIALQIETQYSDGIFRPSPRGTAFTLEFAPKQRSRSLSMSATERNLRWKVVRSRTVESRGLIRVSSKANRTGYWRIRVGDQVSRTELVRVRR